MNPGGREEEVEGGRGGTGRQGENEKRKEVGESKTEIEIHYTSYPIKMYLVYTTSPVLTSTDTLTVGATVSIQCPTCLGGNVPVLTVSRSG